MTQDDVDLISNALVRTSEQFPEVLGVCLYGSWARGTARANSDLDILIILQNGVERFETEKWLSDPALPQVDKLESLSPGKRQRWGVMLKGERELEIVAIELGEFRGDPIRAQLDAGMRWLFVRPPLQDVLEM